MKAHDGEFEKIRESFERIVKSSQTKFYFNNLKRSPRDFKMSFYDNGETDKFFHMFMQGYAYAKCMFRVNNIDPHESKLCKCKNEMELQYVCEECGERIA